MAKNYINIGGTNCNTIYIQGVRMDKIYGNGVLIYQREQTIFSGVNVQSGTTTAGNPYESKNGYSIKYPINFSEFDLLTITGTAGGRRTSNGTYNRYTGVYLEYSMNGTTWTNLETLYYAYQMGGEGATLAVPVDISTLSGEGYLRIRCWCRNSNIAETSGGYAYASNMTCTAQ